MSERLRAKEEGSSVSGEDGRDGALGGGGEEGQEAGWWWWWWWWGCGGDLGQKERVI